VRELIEYSVGSNKKVGLCRAEIEKSNTTTSRLGARRDPKPVGSNRGCTRAGPTLPLPALDLF